MRPVYDNESRFEIRSGDRCEFVSSRTLLGERSRNHGGRRQKLIRRVAKLTVTQYSEVKAGQGIDITEEALRSSLTDNFGDSLAVGLSPGLAKGKNKAEGASAAFQFQIRLISDARAPLLYAGLMAEDCTRCDAPVDRLLPLLVPCSIQA